MATMFPDIKKGGSKTYYDARDMYRQAIGAIMPGDGDEDEDEAAPPLFVPLASIHPSTPCVNLRKHAIH